MDLKEIVMKLVGPVFPVGDTNEDEERFKNLCNLCELTNNLIAHIDEVACENKNQTEYSRKRAGEFAYKVLVDQFGIQ
jgi:hypothetical protein